MCFADQRRMPLPMWDLPPDPSSADPDFGKTCEIHIRQITWELIFRAIEGQHLHHVATVSHHAPNRVECHQGSVEVSISGGLAPIPEIVKGSTSSVIAARDPVGRRRLASPVDLPAMIENVNSRIRRAGHDERRLLLSILED